MNVQNTTGVSTPPLSKDEICAKIKGLTPVQVELIGTKLAELVFNNVGMIAKYRVAMKVREVNKDVDKDNPMAAMLLRQAGMHARTESQQGKKFLTNEQFFACVMHALWPIKKQINQSFSVPETFLSYGVRFLLSDYEPEGFLAETAEKVGIDLSLIHVPPKYSITLELDKEAWMSDLAFVLKEKSEGVEFSKTSFKVAELEKEMFQSKQ